MPTLRRYLTCFVAVLMIGAVDARADGIAFLDLDRAFNALGKTKAGHQRVAEAKEAFKGELKEMNEELQTLLSEQDAISQEAQDPALNEEVREQRRDEFEVKTVEISEFRSKKNKLFKDREQQLQRQILRMRQDIIDDIVRAAENYATDEQFDMVLDVSARSVNQVPVVLYYGKKNDITDTIIDLLNREDN